MTVAGMAHFAGTGVPNKRCRTCVHFCKSVKQSSNKGICRQFKKLTGKEGKAFDASNHSCKYYEEAANDKTN